MNIWDMFADAVIKSAKKRPYFDLEGYMNRWWFIKPKRWLPFAIRVHEILRSDSDRHLHDHPWHYVTVILKGGYYETTFNKYGQKVERWHGPGSILVRTADTYHSLRLPEGKTCWTMFSTGRWRQDWGFKTETGKVWWRVYLNQWDDDPVGAGNDALKKKS